MHKKIPVSLIVFGRASVKTRGRDGVGSRHGYDGGDIARWEEGNCGDTTHGMTHDDDRSVGGIERKDVTDSARHVFGFEFEGWAMESRQVFIELD